MSKVTLKVEIGDGSTWFDISQYVYSASWSCTRSDELNRITTGNGSLSVNNNGRLFDPLNVSSTYYPYLKPRKNIRFTANTVPVFYGWIDDIGITYEQGNISTTSFTLVDGFGFIQGKTPATDLTIADTNANAYMSALAGALSLSYTGDTNATTSLVGNTYLAPDELADIPGDELFPVMQKVAESEGGFLFPNASGGVTFKSRKVQPAYALTFTDQAAESSAVVNYQGVSVVYGSENLYNSVSLDTVADSGISAVRKNASSISSYGTLRYENTGLLTLDQGVLDGQAEYLAAIYGQPKYRFESVSVLVENLSLSANATNVLTRSISDAVLVKFFPSQYGQPISQLSRIVGVTHDYTPEMTTVTFQLENVEYIPFTLDSATYGVLDTNRLGY